MKKSLTIAIVYFLVFMIISTMTGCSEQNSSVPVAVAIVIGNHANSRAPNLASPEIEKIVQAATSSYGFVSIVASDGSPELVGGCLINPPQAGLAKSKLNQIATEQARSILSSLLAVKASHPEVDTLAALEVARRSFASAPQNNSRHIVVLDSGLSTKGSLNFQKSDFLDADPSAVAGYLNAQKEIPNFSGITITWIGLGDIAEPQKSMSAAQRANLKQIWTAIIEKTGGNVIFLDTLSGSDNPAKDYPKVSVVSLLSNPSQTFDNSGAVVFRNIQFIGDTAEYTNPEEVTNILKPVAEYMKSNPGFAAMVIGSTAGEKDKDFCLRLSSQRADAVRDTLVFLGASASQIKAIGLGFNDPWHIPDTSADGTLIESIAAQNRKVVLMDASSAEAQSILARNN
jgi:outer membrane protein OmpA-like peptidoglycan-associated protein